MLAPVVNVAVVFANIAREVKIGNGLAQLQPAISESGAVSVLVLCAVAFGVGLPMRQRPAIASVHDETRVIPVVLVIPVALRRPVAVGAPAQSAAPPCADHP